MWNVSGDLGYQGTVATSGTLLGLAFECANSYDPDAVLACMDSMDVDTVVGPLKILPGTYHFDRPYLCIQQINSTKYNLVYPTTYPQAVPLVYSWVFEYLKAFLDSLKVPSLTKRDYILIITFSILGALILGVIVAIFVIRYKYYTVLIEKKDIDQGEDPEM